jgi:hypothetical protein
MASLRAGTGTYDRTLATPRGQVVSNYNAGQPALTLIPRPRTQCFSVVRPGLPPPPVGPARHHQSGEARAGLRSHSCSRSPAKQFRLLLRLQSRSIKSTFFHAWLRWEGVDDRAIDERSVANWSILVLPAREFTLSGKRRRGPLPNLLGPHSRYADRPGCFAPAPERRGIGSDDFHQMETVLSDQYSSSRTWMRLQLCGYCASLSDQRWPRP